MRHSLVTVGDETMAAVHLSPSGAATTRVVIVHGMVVASRGVLPLALALRDRGVAVDLPDLPGFGRSTKPRRALDVDGLADALHGWMTATGRRNTPVIGNSFGTQVAGALAARHPGAASRLVLLSPTIDERFRRRWAGRLPPGRPGGPPRTDALGRLQRRMQAALVQPPQPDRGLSLRSLIIREYVAASLGRALSTYRHALRDDLRARMPAIDVPVVVVRGADDGLVSPGWARRLAAAAPQRCYVEVRSVAHDAQFHEPGAIADVVVNAIVGASAR
jgi:pimeloyl-ACP methyl ester carboxylesterase